MILPSTLRKLQEKNARIHRLIWPAHTFDLCGEKIDTPERREYFATESGLNNAVLQKAELIHMGAMPKYQSDMIPARAVCQILCEEIDPKPFGAYGA